MKKSLIILSTILVFSCASQTIKLTEVDPVDNWTYQAIEKATPLSQGLNGGVLSRQLDVVKMLDIDGVVILKNGKKVYEKYQKPFNSDLTHNLFSCTKSVNSILIGIAIDQGYLEGTDQKVMDIFPEFRSNKLDPLWEKITLKHLLTMTAGLPTDSEKISYWKMLEENNWLEYAFSIKPDSVFFGDIFSYSNITSFLLSAIIAKSTNISPLDFARINLFKPLGITNYSWDMISPQGINPGATDINLRTEDFAKIGQLFLNRGLWNGTQVVSEEWIESSINFDGSVKAGFYNYGYQWWLISDGSYCAMGTLGQFLIVYPNENMVFAVNSFIPDREVHKQRKILNLFNRSFFKSVNNIDLDVFRYESKENKSNLSLEDIIFREHPEILKTENELFGNIDILLEYNESTSYMYVNKGSNKELIIPLNVDNYTDISDLQNKSNLFTHFFDEFCHNATMNKQKIFSEIKIVDNNRMVVEVKSYPSCVGFRINLVQINDNIYVKFVDSISEV